MSIRAQRAGFNPICNHKEKMSEFVRPAIGALEPKDGRREDGELGGRPRGLSAGGREARVPVRVDELEVGADG